MHYHWPGNIRELINVIEYAFVLCPGGEISTVHLPAQFSGKQIPAVQKTPESMLQHKARDSRHELIHVLQETGGNKSEAARRLGVSRVTLWKWIKKYGIQIDKQVRE
jgi:transcriptional regulator of acetoin/glycerol metabolism